MTTVIQIIGLPHCGSTVVGAAIGQHDGVKNLGETMNWRYGGFQSVINFRDLPKEKYWIDTSKQITRLDQWLRMPNYNVKVIWLQRPVLRIIESCITRGTLKSRKRLFLSSIILLIGQWLFFKIKKVNYVKVKLKDLQKHDFKTKANIERLIGIRLPYLYRPFEFRDVGTGDPVTRNKYKVDICQLR